MINFAWPWLFILLPLPLVLYFLLPKRSQETPALKVSFIEELLPIAQQQSKKPLSWLKLFFYALIWICLVVAIARPQGVQTITIEPEGRDFMLAVDTSGSMELTDMSWNGRPIDRLEMIKRLFGPFIDERVGDRVGLLFFGSHAYLQAPLTKDRKTVRQWLDDSFIGLAGTQTAIGDGIALGVKKLSEQEHEQSRILILLSDGENNSGQFSPEIATELAQHAGVKIYTIGVASDKVYQTARGAVSAQGDLDETGLRTIAERTGGAYFRARNTQDLVEITAAINALEPIIHSEDDITILTDYYVVPLAIALILLFILYTVTTLRHYVRRDS